MLIKLNGFKWDTITASSLSGTPSVTASSLNWIMDTIHCGILPTWSILLSPPNKLLLIMFKMDLYIYIWQKNTVKHSTTDPRLVTPTLEPCLNFMELTALFCSLVECSMAMWTSSNYCNVVLVVLMLFEITLLDSTQQGDAIRSIPPPGGMMSHATDWLCQFSPWGPTHSTF